jgi:hypothetical protein
MELSSNGDGIRELGEEGVLVGYVVWPELRLGPSAWVPRNRSTSEHGTLELPDCRSPPIWPLLGVLGL